MIIKSASSYTDFTVNFCNWLLSAYNLGVKKGANAPSYKNAISSTCLKLGIESS